MFALIVWYILGVLNLYFGEISRFSYACCWIMLLIELLKNVYKIN